MPGIEINVRGDALHLVLWDEKVDMFEGCRGLELKSHSLDRPKVSTLLLAVPMKEHRPLHAAASAGNYVRGPDRSWIRMSQQLVAFYMHRTTVGKPTYFLLLLILQFKNSFQFLLPCCHHKKFPSNKPSQKLTSNTQKMREPDDTETLRPPQFETECYSFN